MNSAASTVVSTPSTVNLPSEKRMDSSTEAVFELLEQNASWWEQAALTCEHIATNRGFGSKEEWQLMGAVYRERAQKHAQMMEQLREKGIRSQR